MIYTILLSVLLMFSNIQLSNQKLESTIYPLEFNTSNWSYDSDNKVYYQIGVVYCQNAVNTDYQSLGIYVPEEYLSCKKSEEKYDCSINISGKKGSYTAKNAPLVFPLNTPGYSSMKAPTSYNYKTVGNFISQGIIYIYAGCRGRYEGGESYIAGAPWPITDLKSAIRFLRYNDKLIPGDLERIYSFGMSGGGAQSCLMGITGNSELFNVYLEENGAAMKSADGKEIKDNIKGSQCWCPITNLDTADAAYEWNMGYFFSENTRADGTFTKQLSKDLAQKYFEYVNQLKLKDPKGKELTLTELHSGSYYDYLISVIQESLNNFLSDTTFPYTPSEGGDGPFPPGPPSSRRLETVYENAQEYIDSLNDEGNEWVVYDSSKNTVTIKNLEGFVTHCKSASKSVPAFDDLSKKQAENKLFGIDGTTYTKHFDKIVAELLTNNKESYSSLENWVESYPDDYTNDLSVKDSKEKTILERVNMYNPMYYLNSYYEGYKKSDVADYFRINTGIAQGDTGNVVEMNLYLALINYGKNAKFTTVWAKGHVEAERTGTSQENFIAWVNEIETSNNKNGNLYITFNFLLFGLFFILLI